MFRSAATFTVFAACSFASAQPPQVQQHIDHVTAGLLPPVVLKGDLHPAHTLAERMAALHVHGVSIAVIHDGKLEWAQGFGVVQVGGAPVTANTLFQAGSISKPVAATAILRQVQQGKLSLDTDIDTQLTSWKLPADPKANGKPVTLRELLTHTGAITVHGFPGYAQGAPMPTLVQVLNGEPPANTPAIRGEGEPGSKWNYSGGGFTIAQQLTIDQTHESFAKLIHDTVLVPIGMTHSTYDQPLPAAMQPHAATPYDRKGEPIPGGAHTYPELAAAGLWTTPSDLARYLLELNNSLTGKANHVLSQQMTTQMLTPGLGSWGLGIQIGGAPGNPYFTHGGVNEGFESIMLLYEHSGDGAIVMTNAAGGTRIAQEIVRAIADEYHWPDFQSAVKAAIPPDLKLLPEFAGSYKLTPQLTLVVKPEPAGLAVQETGQEVLHFVPSSATVFFSTDAPFELEFTRSADGKPTQVVLRQAGRSMSAPKQ
jgi:CubicO group peptidase (beta-lactamase class C family)